MGSLSHNKWTTNPIACQQNLFYCISWVTITILFLVYYQHQAPLPPHFIASKCYNFHEDFCIDDAIRDTSSCSPLENSSYSDGQVDFLRQLAAIKPNWCRYKMSENYLLHFLIKKMGFQISCGKWSNTACQSMTTFHRENQVSFNLEQNESEILQKFNKFTVFQANAFRNLTDASIRTLCEYQVEVVGFPNMEFPNTIIYEIRESPKGFSTGNETIDQYANDLCTTGGSLFKVIIKGPSSKSFCDVHSYFDGVYHVVCPVFESSMIISFHRMSLNFANYFKIRPHKPTFVHESIMPEPFQNSFKMNGLDMTGNMDFNNKRMEKEKEKAQNLGEALRKDNGIWLKNQNGTGFIEIREASWDFVVNGFPVSKTAQDSVQKCLKNINNLIIIGDEFLMYWYSFLLYKLNPHSQPPPLKFDSKLQRLKNIAFMWNTYAGGLALKLATLKRDLQKEKINLNGSVHHPDIIIVNTLKWDLRHGDIIHAIMGLEYVISSLGNLLNVKGQGLKVVYVGVVPEPDKSYVQSQTVMTLNGWLYGRLASVGVEIFDTFSILYPFNNELNTAGFRNVFVDSEGHDKRTTLGWVYAELLTASLCK